MVRVIVALCIEMFPSGQMIVLVKGTVSLIKRVNCSVIILKEIIN